MISNAAKQRRREKREEKRIHELQAVARLRAEGKACGNCRHFGGAPLGAKGRICELDSDNEGYVIVVRDGLCSRHAPVLKMANDKTQGESVTAPEFAEVRHG